MADKIVVDTDLLNSWASQINSVSGAMSIARWTLSRLDTSDEWWGRLNINKSMNLRDAEKSVSLTSARGSISAMLSTLDLYSDRISELSQAIRSAADGFENAESEVGFQVSTCGDGVTDAVSAGIIKSLGYPSDTSKWTDDMRKNYLDFIKKSTSYTLENGNTVYINDGTAVIITAAGVVQVLDASINGLNGQASLKTYNPDGSCEETSIKNGFESLGFDGKKKLLKPDEIEKTKIERGEDMDELVGKRDATILEFGVSSSKKKSVVSETAKYENGLASGEASYDAFYAERHASLYAGLYSTKIGPDGKEQRVLEPGIDAKIGGSIGLFDGELSGSYGNDIASVHSEVNTAVAKGSAEANLQLGFVDGEFAARGKASAEFNVVEVGAEGGVEILGVDATVGVKGTVGIGGHADVGYSDGKFSFDAGMSLGVGFSVSFEVDVKDLVNNAVDGVQGLCESAVQWFDSWW